MQRLSIMRWQQTQTQYIGVIQTIDRFKPGSLKVHDLGRGESVIVGELAGTYRKDWYALAYNRADMDFDEARTRGIATLNRENELRAAGKPSLAG
ncbi:MAG: hypothetical protein ACUVX1_13305 [Chloroflexota bacterium]